MCRNATVLVSAVVLILCIVCPACPQAPLRIAYTHSPPYYWTEEDGKPTGIYYEITREALVVRMGISVVWTEYPWIRCQENLKNGIDDAVVTVLTKERTEYAVAHKDPILVNQLKIFTYANHPRMAEILRIREIADLKKGNFTAITYSGNGWYRETVAPLGIKTFEAPYLEGVWKMLAEKRGDIAFENSPTGRYEIARAGVIGKVVDTGVTVTEMPFYLMITKHSPYVGILQKFNNVLNEMVGDGTIKRIFSKYE